MTRAPETYVLYPVILPMRRSTDRDRVAPVSRTARQQRYRKEASTHMYRIPYSYEQELNEQVAERLAAFEWIHRADLLNRARRGARRPLASWISETLIGLGTWLQRQDRALDQVAG